MPFEQLSQWRLRRRLVRIHAELVAARGSIGVIEEQLAAFVEDADEARVRSLVSENTADVRTSREAEGHRALMNKALTHTRRRIEQLDSLERELLQRVRP